MTSEFDPPNWTGAIAAEVVKRGALRGDDFYRRFSPTISVRVPRDAEWVARRDEFLARWQALTEEGNAAGFLIQEDCYECPGWLEPAPDFLIEQRPNPDYRPPSEGVAFRIPRQGG